MDIQTASEETPRDIEATKRQAFEETLLMRKRGFGRETESFDKCRGNSLSKHTLGVNSH